MTAFDSAYIYIMIDTFEMHVGQHRSQWSKLGVGESRLVSPSGEVTMTRTLT